MVSFSELPPAERQQIQSILSQISAMTIATSSANCVPHAAVVYFAPGFPTDKTGELSLFFFSEKKSQHSQDLRENPIVAAAIYPETKGWMDIMGLQMRGAAQPVPDGILWEAAWHIYAAKFPFVNDLKLIVRKNTLYTFRPAWMRLVNNHIKFGYKKEWIFR